jgi:hypothetical protein
MLLVNCAAAQFILRPRDAGAKGSGQLELGAFDFAVYFDCVAAACFCFSGGRP